MLSTFFKVYIRAKLPFGFFWVSFRINGVKERRGFVKEMGERGVLAEKKWDQISSQIFFHQPNKDFPREPQPRVKNGVTILL